MSFAAQLVLHTVAAVAETYDLVSSEATKSSTKTVRRIASRDLDKPKGISIAHEVSKDGKTVNSVIFIEQTELGADNVTHGTLRAQFKLTYPVNVITSQHITEACHQMIEFLTGNDTFTYTTTNVDKLKNRES